MFENLENLDTSKCVNMSFAFWKISGSKASNPDITDGKIKYKNNYMKKLDLSGKNFNTSNVRRFDNFFSSYLIETLDISGMDMKGVVNNRAPIGGNGSKYPALPSTDPDYAYVGTTGNSNPAIKRVTAFIYDSTMLSTIEMDGLDLSEMEIISSFIQNTAAVSLDFSKVKGPKYAYSIVSFLRQNKKLTEVIFGSEGNEFEVETDPKVFGVGKNSDQNKYNKGNSVWFESFFKDCEAIETIDLTYLKINKKDFRYQMNSFFEGCKSLTEIKGFESLCYEKSYYGNWTDRAMFSGCESLETIDLSSFTSPVTGPYIFKGCSSLKTLNLAKMGKAQATSLNGIYDGRAKGFYSYDNYTENGVKKNGKFNVYEGCTELSEITFSEYYYGEVEKVSNSKPYKDANAVLTYNVVNDGYSATGISEQDIPPVPADANWIKVKQPAADAHGTARLLSSDAELYPLYADDPDEGKPLTTAELFGDFKPKYAGTWVRIDLIKLKAKGATPEVQTFSGAVGLSLSGNELDGIQTPTRPGYVFLGWEATYEENGETKTIMLEDQIADIKAGTNNYSHNAAAWTYKAKWKENTYNLELDGNLGTTTIVREGEDFETTVTSYIAAENLPYSQYFELNSSMFTRPGYVLAGWNTRSSGIGDSYSANESVARLTASDGVTITLYAQWHKPDLTVTLDPNFTEAETSELYYTLPTYSSEKAYYGEIADAARPGYTFMGWYTTPETGGKQIKANTEVNIAYTTLYARWQENPTITFNANGGEFHTKLGISPTYIKSYNYGQTVGVIPTPVSNTAVIWGWYTKDGTDGDWGNDVTSAAENGGTAIASISDKVVTASAEYYAKWGYQPEFESNGGVYDYYGYYPVRSDYEYVVTSSEYYAEHPDSTIPVLPTFTSGSGTFQGWYFGDFNVTEYLKTHDTYTLDMRTGKTLEASWADKNIYEITLNAAGGNIGGSPNPIKVYSGNKIEQLPTPKKANYEFLGWFLEPQDDSAENPVYTEVKYTDIPEGSCTIYAHWEEQKWTVTYDPGAGSIYLAGDETAKVTDGGHVRYLPRATRTENTIVYSLDGWYLDPENPTPETKLTLDTEITGDVTYKALWKLPDEYLIESPDKLYKYAVKWDTPSNEYATSTGDDLIITPANGNSPLSARLSVRFMFNTKLEANKDLELPVGSVEIHIPKYLFGYDDNGTWNNAGSNNISVGFSTTNTTDSHFIYSDDPGLDYYVITNNEKITYSSKYYDQEFLIDYILQPSDMRKMKGGYFDENGYYAGEFYQKDVQVQILVNEDATGEFDADHDLNETKHLNLELHTKVEAATAKTRTGVSFEWQSAWGEKPQDADQYFYVTWDLTASFGNTNSQNFKYSWSEDPVHDGSLVTIIQDSRYSTTSYMTPSTYHTTVVTKHLRKVVGSGWKTVRNEAVLNVESVSGYKQQVRVSKEEGIYLIEEGVERVFEKFILGYSRGADRIKSGATELILNRSGVSDLWYEIVYQEYKNSHENDVDWYPATKTYEAPERTIEISDGATKNGGDVVLSPVYGNDKYNWNNSDNVTLSDADYSFTSLNVYLTEFDAVKVGDDWSEPYEHTSIKDYGTVEVWIRGENETEFRLFKTLKNSDFSEPVDTGDELKSYGLAVAKVTLPDRNPGYKIVHKSTFFASKISVCPNMFLRSTNKVYTFVQDNTLESVNSMIKNNAVLKVNNEEPVDSKRMDKGGATVCSFELKTDESYIHANKICATDKSKFTIDNEAGTQEFPVLISGWGTNRNGSTKLIKSGVFYDLLPYNFTVDRSSVYVKRRQTSQTTTSPHAHDYYGQKGDNGNFPSAMYSVEFFENWEGSGRTMMKITINGVPERYATTTNGFNVFYLMKTTMSNVIANGTTQMNYVSFTDTTEGQTVPVTRNGTLSSLAEKIRPYYQSIEDENAAFTAYFSQATSCQNPVQFAKGFSSSVKTEGSLQLKEKVVGLDTEYTYNVLFTNGNQTVDDLVIYDVIENYSDDLPCEWYGKFQSVDVSAISRLEDFTSTTDNPIYCAPKVYYCLKDTTVTDDELNIDDPELADIWTDVAPVTAADKARVKAIAVDCRANTSGTEEGFVLRTKQAVTFNINMISPADTDRNDKVTYNEATVTGVMNGRQLDDTSITSISLHYANPLLGKTSFPDSGTDDENRTGVVNKSTIEYNLAVTNPDSLVPIRNIIVEDLLDSHLDVNGIPQVKIGDDDPIPITNAAGVSYSVDTLNEGTESEQKKFTATVNSLDPGKTITIIVPASVNGADNGYEIDNSAAVTSANGSTLTDPIVSETTYHYVTNTQVKIKKVDANKNGLAGATLQILNSDKTQVLQEFVSDGSVYIHDLEPGDYYLRELYAPGQDAEHPDAKSDYKKVDDDIEFTVDREGINHVGGQAVNYIEVVDMPAYRIVFHENKQVLGKNEVDKVFRTYGPADIKNNDYKIEHFYQIPSFAGDDYVFAGWYHLSGYAELDSSINNIAFSDMPEGMTPADFGTDTYPETSPTDPQDYHLYAMWIPVGTVDKAAGDINGYGTQKISEFSLIGVQIRDPGMFDSNYNTEEPEGMRFFTSLSDNLYGKIDSLSAINVGSVPLEYGYVVGVESDINVFTKHYDVKDPSKYKLQYCDTNVNGVDTTQENSSPETDFRYISNIDCTSAHGINGATVSSKIKDDHRYFEGSYRLYTLVITYEGEQENKSQKVDARSYIRYYDANNKLRVFYNDYNDNAYNYGGCLCSFKLAQTIATQMITGAEEEAQGD